MTLCRFQESTAEGADNHMNDVHDCCGVAAAALLRTARPGRLGRSVPQTLCEMLLDLQHRGQLSAGMATFERDRSPLLRVMKGLGTVGQAFGGPPAGIELRDLVGSRGIGHVRYATCGADDLENAQPSEHPHGHRWKWFAVCFNGQITNFRELKDQLASERGYHLIHEQADTEVLMHLIAYGMRGPRMRPVEEAFAELAARIDGAYTLAMINAEGEIVVARDPMGFRPLCHGLRDGLWAAASESVALANLGIKDVQQVEPGTMVVVRDDEVEVKRFADTPRRASCYFEWVYFANAASVLDGRSVYVAREELGRELARFETLEPSEDSVVVPVPDCARPAADAMAYELGIPCMEGLLRNRYVGRTFIEGRGRGDKARKKYTPLREVLQGKRVFLVEDSIVRLTTLAAVVRQMRERGGAREIHVRVTCPPVLAPCFYGIDMSTVTELYAHRFIPKPIEGRLPEDLLARMASDMGADSLFYMPIQSIPRCIGMPRSDLCMACIDARYPTAWGCKLYEEALQNARAGQSGRTYEQGTQRQADVK